jgi:hypothetical protein
MGLAKPGAAARSQRSLETDNGSTRSLMRMKWLAVTHA